MYMRVHAGLPWTEFFVTALALYSSVKQLTVLVEADHVGWSPFISRIVHKRLRSFGGHGQQQRFYVSQPQHKDPLCFALSCMQFNSSPVVGFQILSKTCLHAVQFFPCGWVPNTFENMVALNTAVDLKSLHSQFRRASVRHVLKLKALRLRPQVQFQIAKFKFRQYQNTTFFRHFAKFNAHQISRYTVLFDG